MKKVVTSAVLMFLLAGAGKVATVHAGEDGDREKIQGTWVVSAGEKEGQEAPAETLKDFTLTFTGDTFTHKMGGNERKGTFSLDSTKSPREITLSHDGSNLSGIYTLEGDDLKMCVAHGDERPTEFASKEGAKTMLLILKRKKP
jgi:uncharacterized protein (TIGR03067 family)